MERALGLADDQRVGPVGEGDEDRGALLAVGEPFDRHVAVVDVLAELDRESVVQIEGLGRQEVLNGALVPNVFEQGLDVLTFGAGGGAYAVDIIGEERAD